MRYSWGVPPRSLTKATVWPVFGFQLGDMFAPLEMVRRLGRPPLRSETYSSGFPCMEDEKIICVPSGDQAGVILVPWKRGKETSLPVSRENMQICALVRPAEGAKQVNAMREASGDQRGVRAMDFRLVNCLWFVPS